MTWVCTLADSRPAEAMPVAALVNDACFRYRLFVTAAPAGLLRTEVTVEAEGYHVSQLRCLGSYGHGRGSSGQASAAPSAETGGG